MVSVEVQTTTDDSSDQPLLRIDEAFSAKELLALCQRIMESGVLGRSKNYSALLEYLVQCSLSGKSPKEIEIAVDVFNRGDNFDVAADSSVRVYIHQLRKKLDVYYQSNEKDTVFRIVIPKGQYTILAQQRTPISPVQLSRGGQRSNLRVNNVLLLVVIILLPVNFLYKGNTGR